MKKALVLLILTAFVGCNTATAKAFSPAELGEVSITMMWWGNDSRHAAVNAALDLFESRFPNVTIFRNGRNFGGYQDFLYVDAINGQLSDVFQLGYGWLTEFDEFLLDLRNVAHVLDLTEFSEGLVDMSPFAANSLGEIVAFPLGVNGRVIVYNRDILAEYGLSTLPQTLPELFALGELFAENANFSDSFLEFDEFNMNDLILTWLYNETGKPLITDGKISYSVAEVETAFWAFFGLLASYTLGWDSLDGGGGASAVGWDAELGRFRLNRPQHQPNDQRQSDRAGAVSLNVEQIFQIVSHNDGVLAFMGDVENQDDMGIALFPPLTDGGRQAVLQQPTSMFGISERTEQPELSAFLLNWLLTDEDALRLLGGEFGVLGTRTAWDFAVREGLAAPPIVELMEMLGELEFAAIPSFALDTGMVFRGRMAVIWDFIGGRYAEWVVIDGERQLIFNATQAAEDWINLQNEVLQEWHDEREIHLE